MNLGSDLEKLRYMALKGWGHENYSVAVNYLWAVNIGIQPRVERCFSCAKFLVDGLICMQKCVTQTKVCSAQETYKSVFQPRG